MKQFHGYRWRIVALLFFATTVNYIDRNVLSFTMIDDGFRHAMLDIPEQTPLTAADLDTFKQQMGFVDAAFKTAYAIGFLLVGWFIDRVGTRAGFSWSIIVWSAASVFHGLAVSFRSLSAVRFILGFGEAGNFPSAVKSVAEWFPKRERALATGVFNAGSSVGIILTALIVPSITLRWGWRASFLITGALGVLLWISWRVFYRKPEEARQLSETELAYIRSDADEAADGKRPSWFSLLGYRQTWAVAACKFFADPIWYFYLTWLPDFFNSNDALDEKLDLKNIGVSFLIIYLVSDAGSIFFGWLSSFLIRRGKSVNFARKFAMLLCALCVVPIVFASGSHSYLTAAVLIAIAAGAHQGWSANVYTLGSDMFPKSSVSSVMGIAGVAGATGGILLAASAGVIRVQFGYQPLFIIAATAYLAGWIILCILAPKLERISV